MDNLTSGHAVLAYIRMASAEKPGEMKPVAAFLQGSCLICPKDEL